MFKAFFSIIVNLIATLIQIVTYPLNLAITSTLPDFSDKILQVTSGIPQLFNGLSWALGFLPGAVVNVLLFMLSVEIAKHTIYISTHTLERVWTLLQKLKIW